MKALVLIDLQNDFMPGGALAVTEGDRVVPIANRLMPRFDLVVATQDWHPAGHCSFASQYPGKSPGDVVNLGGVQQVLWPEHCVQGSTGAELHHELNHAEIDHVVHKGTDAGIDSYSGFYDNQRTRTTGLTHYLRERGVTGVYIMGLATDYCVKYTALDAVKDGFHTWLIKDGCRGVNLNPGDVEAAVSTMGAAGVQFVESRNFAQDD